MSAIAGISVVIPNYNGSILLPQVLPTVFVALNNTGMLFEIIVVDDCSVDGSVQLLEEKFPGVKIIQNQINSGFSVTSNKGIVSAKYDWLLLLNSDVKLEPDYFKFLIKYTERSNVFGVMGRIIGWEDDTIQDGAKYPFFHGVKIKTSGNYLLKNKAQMADGLYSMYLSGANAFINKKIFLSLGGFNELFSPFYVEDFEISLRAWRLGFKCYYDYNAICRHRTSSTVANDYKKKEIKKIYYCNKMFLHAIHLSGFQLFVWYLQLIPEILIKIFTLRFYYLGAVKMFFLRRNSVKRSRDKFLQVASENNAFLSINEVVSTVLDSISGRPIERF